MNGFREIEPCKFVFVVGTPGAGKSLFCKELATVLDGKGLRCDIQGDYPYLQLLYRTDPLGPRSNRFRPGKEGAEFVVTDPLVYDEALELLHKNVLLQQTATVKIIEFARPRYDTAFLYHTLGSLLQSAIVHISTKLEVCVERNERRKRILEELKRNIDRRLRGAPPTHIYDENPDVHYVPPEVMSEFYAKDTDEDELRSRDQKLILSLLPARSYVCIENNDDNMQTYREVAREVTEERLLPLITGGESYRDYYGRRFNEISEVLGSYRSA
jgi:hypothetical protein